MTTQAEPKRKMPKTVGGYEIKLKGRGRQFKSDFMEQFGRSHGLAPLAVYGALSTYTLYLTFAATTLSVGAAIGLVLSGLLFWTFAEYWLHRKFFHWMAFPETHYFIHGIHHEFPNDEGRMVMPVGSSILPAVGVAAALYFTAGWDVGLPLFTGIVAGYAWYDTTHFWTHVGKPKSRWGKMLRRNHMVHHFQDPERLFGVTNPLWDYIFRTGPAKDPETHVTIKSDD